MKYLRLIHLLTLTFTAETIYYLERFIIFNKELSPEQGTLLALTTVILITTSIVIETTWEAMRQLDNLHN